MMTLPTLSQSIKKDSITIAKPTFKSIVRDSRKCESMRMAYKNQLIAFEDLINQNKSMFEELDFERTMRLAAEKRSKEVSTENLKLAKKERRKPILTVGTGLFGLALGIIIAK